MRMALSETVQWNFIESALAFAYALIVYVFHVADMKDDRKPDELLLLLLFVGIFAGMRLSHTLYTYGLRLLPGALIAIGGFVAAVMVLYRGTPSMGNAGLMLSGVALSALATWLQLSRRDITPSPKI